MAAERSDDGGAVLMVTIGSRVEGLKEARRVLSRISAETKDSMKAANRDAAQIVVNKALPNVPVRTGRLRTSVRAMASGTSARAVAGQSSVPYATTIHFGRKVGNVGRPPGNRKGRNVVQGRPFLHDAAARSDAEVVAVYEEAVRKAIKDAAG